MRKVCEGRFLVSRRHASRLCISFLLQRCSLDTLDRFAAPSSLKFKTQLRIPCLIMSHIEDFSSSFLDHTPFHTRTHLPPTHQPQVESPEPPLQKRSIINLQRAQVPSRYEIRSHLTSPLSHLQHLPLTTKTSQHVARSLQPPSNHPLFTFFSDFPEFNPHCRHHTILPRSECLPRRVTRSDYSHTHLKNPQD